MTESEPPSDLVVRRARTADVRTIRQVVDGYAADRILLAKENVTLYEAVQEFWVAEHRPTSQVVGCGALHVMWEDLAEVRTLAVDRAWRRHGIGHAILTALLGAAAELGIVKVFCLTFEVDFFTEHGFVSIDHAPVASDVFGELLRSHDEGVAEFLDLDRVKPNTLGNTRMIRHLTPNVESNNSQ